MLFGSLAVGRDSDHSDVDLLVWLLEADAAKVASLGGRLRDRIGREVQLVRVQDAERSPALMADALADGRVLVDRDGVWPDVKAAERSWRRRAAAQEPLEHVAADLELS